MILDTDPQGSLGKWFLMRKDKLKDKNTIEFKTASLWGAQYEAKSLKQKSDIVIIDTPPKIDADGRPAIEIADLVVIPISPSQVDFWATESIIELAKREKKEILILINRANAKSKLIHEAIKFVDRMKVKKAKTILRQVDKDGDGKVSREEFAVVAEKFPNILFPRMQAKKKEED